MYSNNFILQVECI